MGSVFERMAKDYIMKYSDVPFLIKDIGRWRSGNPRTKKDAEIDVVAISAENPEKEYLFFPFLNNPTKYLLNKRPQR